MNRFLMAGLAFIVLIFSWGCTDTAQDTEMPSINLVYAPEIEEIGEKVWPEKNMKKRFSNYWNYRLAGNFEKTWNMEAPHIQFMGFRKAYERFFAQNLGQVLEKVTIYGVDKEHENMYKVRAEINFVRHGNVQSAHILDTWVKVQGDWYHVERNPLVFPFSM